MVPKHIVRNDKSIVFNRIVDDVQVVMSMGRRENHGVVLYQLLQQDQAVRTNSTAVISATSTATGRGLCIEPEIRCESHALDGIIPRCPLQRLEELNGCCKLGDINVAIFLTGDIGPVNDDNAFPT